MKKKNYILITPARNEERFIKKTIECVVVQTILPKKWVIVSDGSIDGTDEIVKQYKSHCEFISLLHVKGGNQRSFASKALAFKAGYELLKDSDYDFVGNLDADITFGTTYYERMLREFEKNLNLGTVGGVILYNVNSRFVKSKSGLHITAGAFQLFRRACYEEIGGYIPVRTGGMDSVALLMARMRGWETRMLRDVEVFHHRQEGTDLRSLFKSRNQHGKTDYNLGLPFVFALAKAISRCYEKPYVLSSMMRLAGYLWSWVRREERDVPEDFVKFYRGEQLDRLRAVFSNEGPTGILNLVQKVHGDFNIDKD